MNTITVYFSFLLVVHSCCWAVDKEIEQDGVTVKVLGHSGKVRISSNSASTVNMEMDELAEYADDTKVGNSGKEKHSFNTFASQDFEFTDVKNKEYRQNISATGFDFIAKIRYATLTVAVTIFKEDGVIVNDNEEIEVKKGNVKTDITISNWTFCDPCKAGGNNEIGDNLRITITIKGKNSSPTMKEAKNATKVGRMTAPSYDMGGNVTLILSKKYKDNEQWKDMKAGYPKLTDVGQKKSFVFRFEKFTDTVFYDPVADLSQAGSQAGIVKVSAFSIVLALFINLIHFL